MCLLSFFLFTFVPPFLRFDAEYILKLWADMLSRGIKPTEFNYESRIHAHCSAGWMHSAFKVGDEMREAGFPWTVMTYTSMIAGCNRKRYYKR